MLRNRLLGLGAALALLVGCAPTVVQPLKGAQIPLPGEGMGVPTLVLPGNPLLLMDDFEGYPVGAVLTAVAPKRYSLFAGEKATFTVAEALDPRNTTTHAVRLAYFRGALLTTGAGDWTDYRARFEVLVQSTGEVQFRMDGKELLTWRDPDLRQGGLAFGVYDPDLILYLDNLEATPL